MARRTGPLLPVAVFVGLLLLLTAVLPLRAEPRDPAGEDAEPGPVAGLRHLHPGMPAAEVLRRLDRPQHIARQVLYGRYVEQWTYDSPPPVRITFDWRKGQEKQIQTVQPLSSPGR